VSDIGGEMLVGYRSLRGTSPAIRAFNPSIGREILQPSFRSGTLPDVNDACELANGAFNHYRSLPLDVRATFAESVACAFPATSTHRLSLRV
jgi:NADP-dependent aldehyde dehydrogenase